MASPVAEMAAAPADATVPAGASATTSAKPAAAAAAAAPAATTTSGTLSVTDNRTGKSYTVPVHEGRVNAVDLKKIVAGETALVSYDPGYLNTACCSSKVSFIDGEKGILMYRGYRIEELAEKSTFLEVAFLLIFGELPSREMYTAWHRTIMSHTFIHENLVQLMRTFRYDAHPMGMLVSSIAALSTFYPEANPALAGSGLYGGSGLAATEAAQQRRIKTMRNKQIFRILGKLPTIAACSYRHRVGRPYNNPAAEGLGYTENFLYMMDRLAESDYRPDPRLARALDILFILHAEHEINCSTATMRQLTSTLVDPYTAVAGAAAALYGPLHGGANEAVLRMLESIGDKSRIAQFLDDVKSKKRRLMGFGHRIYRNYDPRAKILKEVTRQVFDVVGRNPLMEVAEELERLALTDDYFIRKRLYPNVDFYSGIIYNAMGFPTDMFPVLFSIPRAAGWLAHWVEMLDDSESKIYRPRQHFTGHIDRPFVPLDRRVPLHQPELTPVAVLATYHTAQSRRRGAAPAGGAAAARL